jgi:hypothetical protein
MKSTIFAFDLPFGKGEVESSIPSGSTINPLTYMAGFARVAVTRDLERCKNRKATARAGCACLTRARHGVARAFRR